MSKLNDTKLYEATKRLEKRLKDREDEYVTYKQFHILVGTFNVNNRQPPSDTLLEEWLYRVTNNDDRKQQILPDIIAVGFQEIDTSGGAYIYDDRKREDEWERIVRKTIKACYKPKDDSHKFQLLNRIRLMGILLFVYVRTPHMAKCTSISRSSVPTGFMGLAGNKGGVGISFNFYQTQVCFINCHFASGDGQTQKRNEDYQTIESRMTFTDAPTYSLKDYIWYTPTTAGSSAPNPQTSSVPTRYWKINDHDIIFWFGDMNYRISQPNEQVRKAISEVSTIPLHEKDQLRCEMKLSRVFTNYFEPPIDFMPTYKFDTNTDHYDTSEKMRTPSWTDRILYHAKRSKIRQNNDKEFELIQTIHYSCAKTIRFSDHRPVSGLYQVAIKSECDEKRLNRIREELIRELDREENDSIPTIEVRPRPPAIVFDNIRYLDKVTYSLLIKNIGECPCTCGIYPSAMFEPTRPIKSKRIFEDPFFNCLTFTPNSPYTIEIGKQQSIDISFQMKSQNSWVLGKQLNEILILHVENGADTFITADITVDMGPFGLSFEQFPPTLYDSEKKQYVYAINDKTTSERIFEMKNDPPALYISLIDCLKDRNDINLLNIFNTEVQDSIDLIPIRNQIYEHNYNFQDCQTIPLFMILLHLLQSLPEPLISRDIQDRILLTNNSSNFRTYYLPSGSSMQSHIPNETNSVQQHDMAKAVGATIELLKPKERNLFFRFLLLLQKCWPTSEQLKRSENSKNILNVCIDILTLSILHEHADRNQRHTFLLACLNEEKKKHSK
ncbi:unnamed protein product [Adineta steineri]|uniref:Inositol polyphosphate-related phosphatase domain-containing protein n=1 Tax=Adineta steineri TaxID=433720 RepID=A0A815MPH2_9BILA|nr:unnamed protein product [Adineta steineri]CAF1621734.1 unnamed protein product [Adineta steineri]